MPKKKCPEKNGEEEDDIFETRVEFEIQYAE